MKAAVHPLLALALAGLVGCATGSSIEDTTGAGGGGSAGDGGGGSAAVTTSATTASSTSASSASTTGTGGDGGGSAGDGGAGGGADPATTSSSTGMPTCDFTPLEDCANADLMPAISGDEGSDTVTRTGSRSKWFKIHVEETDAGIFATDLAARFKLTSPLTTSYSLRVHEGPSGGGTDCAATPHTATGNPQTINRNWNDSQPGDSSRWFSIEIAHEAGDDCGPSAEWTLEIRGNP